MEEKVGFVDEAHVGGLVPEGEHLPADVKRTHLHVLAGVRCIRLALIVRHHLVFGRPHAEVVNHLEKEKRRHGEGGGRGRGGFRDNLRDY